MFIQITGNSIGQGLATAMDTYVGVKLVLSSVCFPCISMPPFSFRIVGAFPWSQLGYRYGRVCGRVLFLPLSSFLLPFWFSSVRTWLVRIGENAKTCRFVARRTAGKIALGQDPQRPAPSGADNF